MILTRNHWSLAVLATLVLALTSCTQSSPEFKNKTVVKVNNSTLSAGDFSELLAARLKSFNVLSAKDTSVVSQAKNAVVQDFIVRVVSEDWAQSKQIFVRKEQLDAEVATIRKQYPDDISFRHSLADEGLSYEAWETQLKQTLLQRLVVSEITKAAARPTKEQIKEYYTAHREQFQQSAAVKLNQIVLDTEENAQRIKKELSSGKSLVSLAKKFSIVPYTADTNGDNWIEKGTLDVFDNAFKLGVGQRSGILKSPFGFHIYEVTAKRTAKGLSLEEASAKIEKILTAQAEQDIYSVWLEEQILKSRVFKDDDFLKQIHVQTRSE